MKRNRRSLNGGETPPLASFSSPTSSSSSSSSSLHDHTGAHVRLRCCRYIRSGTDDDSTTSAAAVASSSSSLPQPPSPPSAVDHHHDGPIIMTAVSHYSALGSENDDDHHHNENAKDLPARAAEVIITPPSVVPSKRIEVVATLSTTPTNRSSSSSSSAGMLGFGGGSGSNTNNSIAFNDDTNSNHQHQHQNRLVQRQLPPALLAVEQRMQRVVVPLLLLPVYDPAWPSYLMQLMNCPHSILGDDWAPVWYRIWSHPHEITTTGPINQQTALHFAVLRYPPTHIIAAMIAAAVAPTTPLPHNHSNNTNLVSMVNTNNETALHLATSANASEEVLTLLIRAAPNTVAMPDRYGDTPLHYAARQGATYELLSLMIQSSPTAIAMANHRQVTPFWILPRSFVRARWSDLFGRRRFRYDNIDDDNSSNSNDVVDNDDNHSVEDSDTNNDHKEDDRRQSSTGYCHKVLLHDQRSSDDNDRRESDSSNGNEDEEEDDDENDDEIGGINNEESDDNSAVCHFVADWKLTMLFLRFAYHAHDPTEAARLQQIQMQQLQEYENDDLDKDQDNEEKKIKGYSVTARDRNSSSIHPSMFYWMVHAAAQTPVCPRETLHFLCTMLPGATGTVDRYGFAPLHYACMAPVLTEPEWNEDEDGFRETEPAAPTVEEMPLNAELDGTGNNDVLIDFGGDTDFLQNQLLANPSSNHNNNNGTNTVVSQVVTQEDDQDDDEEEELAKRSVLEIVLESNPAMACVPDARSGRLPLAHAVVTSDKSWKRGVRQLIAANPRALEQLDSPTLLPMFLLAAMAPSSSASYPSTRCHLDQLNTLYHIVRLLPNALTSSRVTRQRIRYTSTSPPPIPNS